MAIGSARCHCCCAVVGSTLGWFAGHNLTPVMSGTERVPSLRDSRASRGIARGMIGTLTSILLHGLLVATALLGAAARHFHQPNQEGAGASARASGSEPVMTLFLINSSQAAPTSNEVPESIASRGLTPKDMPLEVLSPDPLPYAPIAKFDGAADESSATAEATGDQQGRALMFGRYMGQITARVQRAWLRPRDMLDGPLFHCRVKILQSKAGEVKEITLEDCNGDPAWQVSLANAIQNASPLPAPPNPSVFADALSLTFTAEPYRAGGSEEGFEAVRIQVANATPTLNTLIEAGGLPPQSIEQPVRGGHLPRDPVDVATPRAELRP